MMTKNKIQIFNTPEEIGVRILFILSVCNKQMSSQRLLYYDYFVLHLNDIDDLYESLHPSNPNHSSEIAVRRDIISQGLQLMISKGLLDIKYTKKGIYYQKNSMTDSFLQLFETEYVDNIKKNTKVVDGKFSTYSDEKLYKYINKNIGSWIGEFEKEHYDGGVLNG